MSERDDTQGLPPTPDPAPRRFWFYWPMLGTGLGVLVTGIVLGGVGGLFGRDWEQRQVERYLGQPGGHGERSR